MGRLVSGRGGAILNEADKEFEQGDPDGGESQPEGWPCFAYGSNLDEGDLAAWVARQPDCAYPFTDWEPCLLPDHAPAFPFRSAVRGGGVLDVTFRRGFAVPGALFHVAAGGWETLDRKEGHPFVYRRTPVTVLDLSGRERPALTYQVVEDMRDPSGFVAPAQAYVDVVCRGLAARGLGDAHVREAAAASPRAGRLNALFVYGTLRRGECRHSLLEESGCRLVRDDASLAGALLDLGAFPGLVPGKGGETVRGEVYAMPHPEPMLEELDEVEGFPGFGWRAFFRRTALYASFPGGGRLLVWVYVYARDSAAPRIPSGDWLRRQRG